MFKVLDANGQGLAYVYARETREQADIAKVLTFDGVRCLRLEDKCRNTELLTYSIEPVAFTSLAPAVLSFRNPVSSGAPMPEGLLMAVLIRSGLPLCLARSTEAADW